MYCLLIVLILLKITGGNHRGGGIEEVRSDAGSHSSEDGSEAKKMKV